jgi:glycosyltransferase involved in cell wall biosynthesis
MDALNRRRLERRLAAHVAAPERTIPWIRYATPELVPFAERPVWPLVVFEAVDDHLASPGVPPRLRTRLAAAEERLLRRSGLVFAWSEPIAERLRARHDRVVVTGAAVDLEAFAAARATAVTERHLAVYAGSLDRRFDAALVAATARALPGWRFLLAGPADETATRLLGPLPNVELTGRLAPEAIPDLLARAAVCLMPYRLDAFNDTLFPLKLVESLASGRPAVGTPIRPAREFGDVVWLARNAKEFAAAIEAASREPDGASAARLARAAPYGWEARMDAMAAALESALP